MDIHEKSTNLNMSLQSGILRKLGVCVRVGRSAPPGTYRVNMKKSKPISFSQTFEVAKNKVPLFFHFWPLGQNIED